MNITITTSYEIENGDGDIRTIKAEVGPITITSSEGLKTAFDMHTEKLGAVERKLSETTHHD